MKSYGSSKGRTSPKRVCLSLLVGRTEKKDKQTTKRLSHSQGGTHKEIRPHKTGRERNCKERERESVCPRKERNRAKRQRQRKRKEIERERGREGETERKETENGHGWGR